MTDNMSKNRRQLMKNAAIGTGMLAGIPLGTGVSRGNDCSDAEIKIPATPTNSHTVVSPGSIQEDIFAMGAYNECTRGFGASTETYLGDDEIKAYTHATAGSDAVAIAAVWIDFYNAHPENRAEIDMDIEWEYSAEGDTGSIADDGSEERTRRHESSNDVDVVDPTSSYANLALRLGWLGLQAITDSNAGAAASYTIMHEDDDGKFTEDSKQYQHVIFEEAVEGTVLHEEETHSIFPVGVWTIPPESHSRLLFVISTQTDTSGVASAVATTGIGDAPEMLDRPGWKVNEIEYTVDWTAYEEDDGNDSNDEDDTDSGYSIPGFTLPAVGAALGGAAVANRVRGDD